MVKRITPLRHGNFKFCSFVQLGGHISHSVDPLPLQDSTHLDLISISSKEDAFTEMEAWGRSTGIPMSFAAGYLQSFKIMLRGILTYVFEIGTY